MECHPSDTTWNDLGVMVGTMDQETIFLTILGMAFVTYLPRLLPMLSLSLPIASTSSGFMVTLCPCFCHDCHGHTSPGSPRKPNFTRFGQHFFLGGISNTCDGLEDQKLVWCGHCGDGYRCGGSKFWVGLIRKPGPTRWTTLSVWLS